MKSLALAASALALSSALDAQTCGFTADAQVAGKGTAGSNGVPQLVMEGAPIVGGSLELHVTRAIPGSLGFFVHGPDDAPVVLPNYGVKFRPGGPLTIRSFNLDMDGRSPALVSLVPVSPNLCGTRAVGQAAVIDYSGQGGLAFTRALRFDFGDQGTTPLLAAPFTLENSLIGDSILGDVSGDGVADMLGIYPATTLVVFEGNGDGTFGNGTPHLLGGRLENPLLADFNSDGRLDCAVLDGDNSQARILLQLPTGGLGAPLTFQVDEAPEALHAADLDADGIQDLAIGSLAHSRVSVHLGRNDGTFKPARFFRVQGPTTALESGDLDGDGIVDLATVSFVGSSVSVLYGKGGGFYGETIDYPTFNNVRDVHFGHFDSDGLLDILLVERGVGWLKNLGARHMAPFQLFFSISGTPVVAFLDVDLDGLEDFASYDSIQDELSIWGADGSGSLLRVLEIDMPTVGRIVAGDADGDGDTDLFLRTSGKFAFAESLGAGTFALPRTFWARSGDLSGVFVDDFDSDQDFDLAVIGMNEISLFRNQGPGSFPTLASETPTTLRPMDAAKADFDGDGQPDLAVAGTVTDEVLIHLSQSNAFGPGMAIPIGTQPQDIDVSDLDGNGTQDLIVVRSGDAELHFGNGDGTFGVAMPVVTPGFDRYVATGDVDGDGITDLVLGPNLQVALGSSGGGFNFASPVGFTGRPVLADVDRDGALDLIVNSTSPRGLSIAMGNGDGSFGGATSYRIVGAPIGVPLVADMNGDRFPDVCQIDDTSTVFIYLGAGDGTFPESRSFLSAHDPRGLGIGTIDLDALPDLVTAGQRDVGIHHNQLLGR